MRRVRSETCQGLPQAGHCHTPAHPASRHQDAHKRLLPHRGWQAAFRGQELSRSAKHSANGTSLSNSRKTSPMTISPGARASRSPPFRPRWVCRKPRCPRRFITWARWFSEALHGPAISLLVTSLPGLTAQNMRIRIAILVRLVMRMRALQRLSCISLTSSRPKTI